MMDQNIQNSCLMVTSFNEETGKTMITYVPLNISMGVLEFFLENGTCTNNHAIVFELETDAKNFWEDMWHDLEAACE